ncbi:MAG: hypothetical protein ABIJ34_06155 [archaeon]
MDNLYFKSQTLEELSIDAPYGGNLKFIQDFSETYLHYKLSVFKAKVQIIRSDLGYLGGYDTRTIQAWRDEEYCGIELKRTTSLFGGHSLTFLVKDYKRENILQDFALSQFTTIVYIFRDMES